MTTERSDLVDTARRLFTSTAARDWTEFSELTLGRLFSFDARGVTDAPVGWLMLFEDGMLCRSVLVDSVAGARAALGEHRREASNLPV